MQENQATETIIENKLNINSSEESITGGTATITNDPNNAGAYYVPLFMAPQSMQQQMFIVPPVPEQVTVPEINKVDTDSELRRKILIAHSSRWVALFLFLQLGFSIFLIIYGAILPFIINSIFNILGFSGLRRQNRCLLITHFTYSLVQLFGLIVFTVFAFFYCYDCDFLVLLALLVAVFFMTICLRKQRILISYLPRRTCCRSTQRRDIEQQAPPTAQSFQPTTTVDPATGEKIQYIPLYAFTPQSVVQ